MISNILIMAQSNQSLVKPAIWGSHSVLSFSSCSESSCTSRLYGLILNRHATHLLNTCRVESHTKLFPKNMDTSRVRFEGIFQVYIVTRLRTGMYRIYYRKRSGDKVSLFSPLKIECRCLQDMASRAQACFFFCNQMFCLQVGDKGLRLWYWHLMHHPAKRYTGIFAQADSRRQTCIKSKNPDLPIWSNQTENHRTVSVRHFVSWDHGPSGPAKRSDPNATLHEGLSIKAFWWF